MRRSVRLALWSLAALCGALGLLGGLGHASPSREVVVVPIEGIVDEGMAHLVARAVDRANSDGAGALVLDINTPGGLVSAGWEIRDALLRSKVPTLAFIDPRAYSAGALITLAAQKIVMAPGATIGAAEPIPNDPKHVSALRADFKAIAERNHRDPILAEAMVDKQIDVPAYKKAGAILSLTADEAKKTKMADAIAPTLTDALHAVGLQDGERVHVEYTWAEQLARFATSPEVSGLLLSLGVLGLLIEMQTLHGIAGLIGIASLALFFGTHVYAGFSNGLVIGLALLGVIGILFELHVVPGHGAAGILGTIALVAAIVLAFGIAFFFVAVQSISIAIVLSVLMFWISSRIFPENAFVKRFTLQAAQGPEYVASADLSGLVGLGGVASSFLRPAGVATVDGKRIPVLTEGDFVSAGTPIVVTRVEGARIFVKPAKEA